MNRPLLKAFFLILDKLLEKSYEASTFTFQILWQYFRICLHFSKKTKKSATTVLILS